LFDLVAVFKIHICALIIVEVSYHILVNTCFVFVKDVPHRGLLVYKVKVVGFNENNIRTP